LTPQEHNKYVGISHLVYGGFMCLMSLLMMGLFMAIMGSMPGGPPAGMMVFFSLFIFCIYGLMTVPSFVAGYGLLKRRRWARTASIVGGVTAAMNFPIGTAVCVYTFWFLFSEPGKAIFEKSNYILPPTRQVWANDVPSRTEQTEYVPPPTPPDWR
jgi:hypothetical protein